MKTFKTLALALVTLGSFHILGSVALACSQDKPGSGNDEIQPVIELACNSSTGSGCGAVQPFNGGL